MRKKKEKGVITDGRNIYEQLSLFESAINGNATTEEPSNVFKPTFEWETSADDSIAAEGNGGSTDEDARRSANTARDKSERLSSRDQFESSETGISEDINNGMVVQPTNIHYNYRIGNKHDLKLSAKQKCENNINAIKLLKSIGDKRYLNANEQEVLSLYSGWGGLPQIFNETDDNWSIQRESLKNIVSLEEYQRMKESVLTSFYTPYEVIEGMYKILEQMGFDKGTVLDPCMGNGNFFGLMPEHMMNSSALHGVELDEVSGNLSKFLYPTASIQVTGYEKTMFPNDYFDLAISNVPFGRFKVHDILYNKYNLDIHNYFFLKTVDKVRPGGIVAFISSTNTMDGNSDIIRLLDERTHFLGAIRLPSHIFNSNGANTSVVSDIIFLQKKNNNQENSRGDLSWLNHETLDHGIKINEYFIKHSNMVFGTLDISTNQYGKYSIVVKSNGKSIGDMFDDNMFMFPANIYEEYHDSRQLKQSHEIPLQSYHYNYKYNEFFIDDDKIYIRKENHVELVEGKKKELEKIKYMVSIVKEVNNIIHIQKTNNEDTIFAYNLEKLNELYDEFVSKHGYINTRTNIRIMKNDPNFYLLTALENVDDQTKEVTKSDFFYKRTIKPNQQVKEAENIFDAYQLSMNYSGKIDLAYMETIYHKQREKIIEELLNNKLAYKNPKNEIIVSADEYLSGNVKEKLSLAIQRNKDNHEYDNNIKDLETVIPEYITADSIVVQLGSSWVPSDYIEKFAEKVFDFNYNQYSKFTVQYSKYTGDWIINSWTERWDSTICRRWGVPFVDVEDNISQPYYNGLDLFDDVINSRIPTIKDYWDETEDGKLKRKSRVNNQRTAIARNIAEKLKIEFSNWIFSDPERRIHLEQIYNELFNCYVERKYNGSFLSFPEMNSSIILEEYQKNCVARSIQSQSTLLSQRVGAGKTFEMVAAAMESKRMGLSNKSMLVVPNHLVDQWCNEFKLVYPQANILAATSDDFIKSKRNAFVHKIATNDYDAIIISHSSFKLIPMDPELQKEHMEEEIRSIEIGIGQLLADKFNNNTKFVKSMERTKKSLEANIKKLTDVPRDNGITFDELGIDMLFVDEAHEFKNLYIYSRMRNVAGVPQTKSQKASDMLMKVRCVQRSGGRVVFATGTPISNTMAELYNLQRYLQEDTLKKANIHCFDAWAKNFGEVISSLEISIDGSSFRTRQRFCKFFNVQELMAIFRQVAEIQTESMLYKALSESKTGRKNTIPPKHIGGKPTVVSLEPSIELEDYIADIVVRSELIHEGNVDPHDDNMLKVTTDSKKASIDLRLIEESYGRLVSTKIETVTNHIYDIYKRFNKDKASQLVFCDFSVPGDGFNIYDEIKSGLILRGILEGEIVFIHSAKTELQKTELFRKVNSGEVRVLLGSTAKLGAGTNVQERLIAVHHVDVPWRASDIEQRNGRAFRQGNMFNEIYEFRYVIKKSFDAYLWQMVETKASYMVQILEGTTSAREIEEDNSAMMSYAEIKAIASGNPLIKEKMELDNDIKRLQLDKQVFNKNKFNAERDLLSIPGKQQSISEKLSRILPDVEKANKMKLLKMEDIEEWFHITLNNIEFTDMKKAGDYLLELSKDAMKNEGVTELGQYCDFKFGVEKSLGSMNIVLLGEKKNYRSIHSVHAVGRVNFIRLYKLIEDIPITVEELKQENKQLEKDIIVFDSMKNALYPEEDKLLCLLKRQRELNKLLDISLKTNEVIDEDMEEEIER